MVGGVLYLLKNSLRARAEILDSQTRNLSIGKTGGVGVGEYTSHFCVTKIYYLARHSPVTFLTFCLREKKGFGCATIPAFLSEADEREQGKNFVL